MNIKNPQNNINRSHLLVVDDEVAVGYLISEILTTQGYEVSLFSNSREALSEFEKTPDKYDLVVTDQSMPGITGSELMKKLLAIRSDIPILMSSGSNNEADVEIALIHGAYGYVAKPINMSSFLQLVHSALSDISLVK